MSAPKEEGGLTEAEITAGWKAWNGDAATIPSVVGWVRFSHETTEQALSREPSQVDHWPWYGDDGKPDVIAHREVPAMTVSPPSPDLREIVERPMREFRFVVREVTEREAHVRAHSYLEARELLRRWSGGQEGHLASDAKGVPIILGDIASLSFTFRPLLQEQSNER